MFRVFQWCFKDVLRGFKGCFKVVSRVLQGCFKGVKERFKHISRWFKRFQRVKVSIIPKDFLVTEEILK